MELFMGLMSGTSMDGIDAALIDVNTHELIGGLIAPYSEATKEALYTVTHEAILPAQIAQLNVLLGRDFATAACQLMKETHTKPEHIRAIGSHGQTICHDALAAIPFTMQLGCPHTIAETTGVPVVADFRTRDVVLGGQGAPFAPLYHQELFSQKSDSLAVINIGGISNISHLNAKLSTQGYDIGPGNVLIDSWIKTSLGKPYDADGAWARTGKVIPSLLSELLKDPYFALVGPKSIGKEYFSLDWLKKHLAGLSFSSEDIQATLVELTAVTIADAINRSPVFPNELLICGGGVHNQWLLERLREKLSPLPILSTAHYGINPDFIEAMMFAWLASETLSQKALNFTSITQASRASLYGVLYLVFSNRKMSLK